MGDDEVSTLPIEEEAVEEETGNATETPSLLEDSVLEDSVEEGTSTLPIDELFTEAPMQQVQGGRRILSASSTHKKIHDHNAKLKEKWEHEGNAVEFESIMGHPQPNDSNDHFCVVEDYPCGPGNDKVYACHYSARDGYKTFCVPEPDSDALRFYPKDYCGPCVGGYVQ